MECISYPHDHVLHALKARHGLPPGAASAPLVAALARVLHELPGGAVAILYVDDFAIFASSKAAAVHTKNTLREALWAAPVGDLQVKFCNVHHVADGFGFLGSHMFRNSCGGATARPRTAPLDSLNQQLLAFDAGESLASLREMLSGLLSWRRAYAAWENVTR